MTNASLSASAHAPSSDERWMEVAIAEARRAASAGEVPVGAVLVDAQGSEIARGRNRREEHADPTWHAEIEALRLGAAQVGGWRLSGCTLYVTLEPCPMCMGALVNARVSRVVWGAADPKAGAAETLYCIGDDARLNHRVESAGRVLEPQCGELLTSFFRDLRAKRKSSKEIDTER